ncbi:PRC-barrel domain protein [Roseivivax sp. THAF40]|uniref:PRC-barrel domain-containing protein n=1 Tax=unclassified Roseivivax TaxID=2639302 RepID=UPI0012A8BA48|nr:MULTISPECIES: PRC-barrel domain-containing protein [unclassified Roseivivax]QFS82482.1 PRC-barrel domain protein [Roseivivax sp. THAF197b]QFT46251.1 PRC-barrel domain protein [Roseivivax sp. THAF40]
MIRLTTSVLALTIAAGGAMAESHSNMEDAEQNLENAAEETGQAIENTAEATENAAENAAQATENAAEEAGQEIENAADETGQALDEAADETAQAAENAAEETEQAAENAGEELEQEANEVADMEMFDPAQLIRTRDITGGPVYSVDGENGVANFGAETYETVGDDWTKIGEIEDIVLSKDGQMRGVVLEIGGFLDIGDKHVFMQMDDVQLVAVDDKTYSIAVGQSEEELEEMESVDEGFWN